MPNTALAPAGGLPGNALIVFPEAHWVTETATGLRFEPDTPLEVWSSLMTRLIRQHKRIEWAIGDAINFGESAYGGTYDQWVEQTGLAENTLSTMRWVSERIEPLRRRKDVGWSHHREVASLPPEAQDRLLDLAADQGMTRYQLREAAKTVKEAISGQSQTADGAPICLAETEWKPGREDLTDETRSALDYRSAQMGRRHAVGFEAGWVAALRWAEQRDCFTDWQED